MQMKHKTIQPMQNVTFEHFNKLIVHYDWCRKFFGSLLVRFYCLNTNPPSSHAPHFWPIRSHRQIYTYIDMNCHFYQVIVDYLYLFLSFFFLLLTHALLTHSLLLHCLLSRRKQKASGANKRNDVGKTFKLCVFDVLRKAIKYIKNNHKVALSEHHKRRSAHINTRTHSYLLCW